jgi:uncharacterized Tic20 family protein
LLRKPKGGIRMPEDAPLNTEEDKQARIWGMLCHLTALLGMIGIPFGHIFGPLIIWLVKKNTYPFVNIQGKESLNFQLSMTIYAIAAALLIFVKIGMPLLLLVAGINFILVIIASIRAFNGETYTYPLAIRLIRK